MSAREGFAVWITGLPGSGKSTITRELVVLLEDEGVRPVVLETDVLRTVLTPEPTYREDERDRFYLQFAEIGILLVDQGHAVVLDATANRRAYRDRARARIARFVEVFVRCPVELCSARDPKGLYAAAKRGETATMPGVQAAYDEPLAAEVILDCQEAPSSSAAKVLNHLRARRYI